MTKAFFFLLFELLAFAAFALGEDTNVAVEPSETDELDEELPEPPKYEIPQGVQTLSFNPSNLTDEDQHSHHLPRDLKCDGCRVVAYVIKEKMKKIQSRYKKGHRLSESDVVDLLDNICKDPEETFNGYGLKEIMGVRRLSGEGLETKDIPGVQSGGGRWPQRLKEICFEYLGEVGEDLIYETFIQRKSLENLLCRDKMGLICPPRKKNKKDKGDINKDEGEKVEKLEERDEKEASKKNDKKSKKDKKSGSKEVKDKKSKKGKQKTKKSDAKKSDEEKIKQKKHKKEKEQKEKSTSQKKSQDKKVEGKMSDEDQSEQQKSDEITEKPLNEKSNKQDKEIKKDEL